MNSGANSGVSEIFLRIAELALVRNGGSINSLPGAWSHEFTDKRGSHWQIAVNGRRERVDIPWLPGSVIEPVNAVVFFNGWPFAVLDPRGGVCGAGEVANEEVLLAAIDYEIQRSGESK